VVAPPRLELGHPCERRILNPLRLPFRQEAKWILDNNDLAPALSIDRLAQVQKIILKRFSVSYSN
jgi:hypothetical protein